MAGLSPADKAYQSQLTAERQSATDTAKRALDQNQAAVDAFKSNSDALAAESQTARASMQRDMEADRARRESLLSETKDRQSKIEGKLASLEAQGVDPNHYWQSLSTGQRIGAAIAIGLGAFGAHALGPRGSPGENGALGIINDAIGRDIDAQKTNLQKALESTKLRADLSARGFDQETALLNAERDSVMTGYQVAMNDIAKRAAMFKDNAEMSQNAARMTAALGQARDERVGAVNEKLYAIAKRAEQPRAGAENPVAKAIRERAMQLADKAAEGGQDMSPADARRRAAAEVLGVDIKPGEPMPSYAKLPSGGKGGQLSPRLVTRVAELNAAEQSIGQLTGLLRRGSSLSPADRGRAEALATELRNQGYTSIPEKPLEVTRLTAGPLAGLAAALQQVRTKKQTILAGGSGPESPEDLGGEKDE
ncbi:MAG TPA: hypothetical protein VE987_08170 [Polyangiaceae bacterium]|nr:hypothetical protein [Polyangiaceae bacterium]